MYQMRSLHLVRVPIIYSNEIDIDVNKDNIRM